MLVMRCAWHRRYFGYPKIYGIDRWKIPGVTFLDGMCSVCARRWRAELRGGFERGDPRRPAAIIPPWLPRVGVVVAIASAVVLAAQPLERAVLQSDAPSASIVSTASDAVVERASDHAVAPASDAVPRRVRHDWTRRPRPRTPRIDDVPVARWIRASDAIVERPVPLSSVLRTRTVGAPQCPCRSVRALARVMPVSLGPAVASAQAP